jgi:hypothetical protein
MYFCAWLVLSLKGSAPDPAACTVPLLVFDDFPVLDHE